MIFHALIWCILFVTKLRRGVAPIAAICAKNGVKVPKLLRPQITWPNSGPGDEALIRAIETLVVFFSKRLSVGNGFDQLKYTPTDAGTDDAEIVVHQFDGFRLGHGVVFK